jgi:hypothetical protein
MSYSAIYSLRNLGVMQNIALLNPFRDRNNIFFGTFTSNLRHPELWLQEFVERSSSNTSGNGALLCTCVRLFVPSPSSTGPHNHSNGKAARLEQSVASRKVVI